MRRNRIAIFIHFVWATWDRLPLITPELEERLYRNIASSAVSLSAKVLAINGVPNHVHVLLAMPSTVTIADMVKKMKGTSSHFVNDQLHPETGFKWQGYYSAFSVSRWDLPKIINYIKNQKTHHASDDLWDDLEDAFEFTDSWS